MRRLAEPARVPIGTIGVDLTLRHWLVVGGARVSVLVMERVFKCAQAGADWNGAYDE